MSSEFARLDIKVDSSSAKTAKTDLAGLETQAKSTERAFADLVKTAAAGVLGAAGLAAIAREADAYANLSARIRLVTKSEDEFNAVRREVIAISKRTGAKLDATGDLYTKMARSVKGAEANQVNFLRVTETINKSMAISGTTGLEAAGVIRQLGQGLASGTLRGDEFNSVMEGAPILMEAVAKAMGQPVSALRALAADGKITSDVLFSSLLTAGKSIDEQFSKMPLTISRATSELKTSFQVFIGGNDQALGASRTFAEGISLLAHNLDTIANAAVAVAIVFGGRYVAAKAEALRATILKTSALAVEAAEELRAARAAEVAAAAELARARALSIMGGGLAAVTAAESAHAAAALRVAEAEAVAATRTGVMATAGRTLSGVLGGPLGIALTVGALALSFVDFSSSTEEAANDTETLSQKISRLTGNIKELKNTEFDSKLAEISSEIKKRVDAISKIQADARKSSAQGTLGRDDQDRIKEKQAELAELGTAYQEVQKQRDQFNAGNSENPTAQNGKVDFVKIALENRAFEAERTKNIAEQVKVRRELLLHQYADELAAAKDNAEQTKIINTRVDQEVLKFEKELNEKKAKQDKDLEDQRLDIAISSAKARGNVLEAEQLELVRKSKALQERVKALGGTDADQSAIADLLGLDMAKAEMADIERRFKDITSSSAGERDLINAQKNAGVLPAGQATEKLRGVDAREREELTKLVELAKSYGAALKDPKLLAELQTRLAIMGQTDASQRQYLATAEQINDRLANGMADALMKVADGTMSAADAFREFAATFLREIAQMILKQVIFNAISGGTAGGGAGGAIFSGMLSLFGKGHAEGGYTGQGGKYQPAGIVHRGEYVIPKHIVEQPGSLEFLRRYHAVGMNALPKFPGFADGGLVAASTMPAAVTPAASMSMNQKQVILFDKDLAAQEIATSRAFEQAVLTVVSTNPTHIKTSWDS